MSDDKERVIFSDAARIPVHLISGFLGSGKTTLLQRLLDHCLAKGLKPAVMMNEYGEVNIDGELLRGQGYSVREMTNGCICCTIGGTLGLALQEVASFHPDVIFIEATGLADPVELIDQATKEDVFSLVRLASLVAVLDPVNFARLAEELHSGIRQQTELADVILLNKSDLADPATLAAITAQVQTLNPRAQILITQRGAMDYDLLLDKQGEIFAPLDRQRSAPVHDHFHTLTLLCATPLVRARFETVMRTLPPTVWRAKGFVRFMDSNEQWMFQSVLGDFAIEWIDLLPEPPEHVVFIGKGFDREALRRAVLSCAADADKSGEE
ncbi:MAG: GTP-binding protein [Deltaproteobacteria bacterium]|nr:GTP-binding protein [Deltaproteobacteria bacterium]